ncbi:hypothetical protein WS83_18370 [Burkholderia sp. MSMB2042]|nr:hypothetical protein WS78_08995 [Burkholderia savannae]KVG37814.1 hypothetical protein WS77_21700 [Burkholderia sp. MSMB0265]KVG78135.1 hypothetical protein WS81_16445 [Burkholderia sp. MSMB2040]KVG97427.1 hypothetical protein WS82_28775 [Burkholderia sp. MSMB2041]KVH01425.1 hypothetical protein WS83_18370 [Burkholderia sp. MSMB2042]
MREFGNAAAVRSTWRTAALPPDTRGGDRFVALAARFAAFTLPQQILADDVLADDVISLCANLCVTWHATDAVRQNVAGHRSGIANTRGRATRI